MESFHCFNWVPVCSPKAAQRGVQATKQILQSLLDGVDGANDSTIYVIDLTPSK